MAPPEAVSLRLLVELPFTSRIVTVFKGSCISSKLTALYSPWLPRQNNLLIGYHDTHERSQELPVGS